MLCFSNLISAEKKYLLKSYLIKCGEKGSSLWDVRRKGSTHEKWVEERATCMWNKEERTTRHKWVQVEQHENKIETTCDKEQYARNRLNKDYNIYDMKKKDLKCHEWWWRVSY